LKKYIAFLLVMILGLAPLSGCGGGGGSAGGGGTPDNSVKKVTISDDKFGDISFSYLAADEIILDGEADIEAYEDEDEAEDGEAEAYSGFTVTIADSNNESLSAIIDFNDQLLPSNTIQYERVHISGDGWNIVIGYMDYSSGNMKSYNATYYFRSTLSIEDTELGGLNGYKYLSGVYMLVFPAATQYGARVIALFPDEPFENTFTRFSDWEYLLEIDQVAAILGTIEFAGELEEPAYETLPVENRRYAVTPTDGWEVYSTWAESVTLKKEGMTTQSRGAYEIAISSWGLNTPQDWVDKVLESIVNSGQRQIDDITINGRTFLVVEHTAPRTTTYTLITSTGPEYDPEVNEVVVIELIYVNDIAEAMPLLENIVIN